MVTANVRAECLHCALPLSTDQRQRQAEYCCAGCEAVHQLIRDGGFERYYEIRRGPSSPPSPSLRPDGFAWLDRLLAGPAVAVSEGTAIRRLTLDVQGIQCTACVWLLRELFLRADGALELRLNPASGKADLTWDSSRLDLRRYLEEARRFGYSFGPDHKEAAPRSRSLLVRLGLCAALAMNVMIFSVCFYTGMNAGDGAIYRACGALSFLFTGLAVVIGGWVFVRSAVQGLRRGLVHLDLPIALGILLGFGGSTWAYVTRGAEHAYFDTVATFVTLMLLGRWLQERVLERNRLALLATDASDQLTTRRRRGRELESVPVTTIEPGDELWVVPGELVPADGISHANGTVALDWITGESGVRAVLAGETVPAGAFNSGTGTLRLTALSDFASSRLPDLLRAPVLAPDPSDPSRRRDRRFATAYVAAVLLLAASGAALWWARDAGKAIAVATSILIVTCPCALGLATPLAHELTHLALRRRGVFLRDGRFLAKAPYVRKILWDKTGTLTSGGLALSADSARALARLGEDDARVLWNLVARSNHPVARCLAAAFPGAREIPELDPSLDVREIPGQGLELEQHGRVHRLGRAAFALGEAPVDGFRHDTLFTVDARIVARLRLEEEIKGDARAEIARLGEEGYELFLLSGDRPDRARRVGERLGLAGERTTGGLTPEAKAELVRSIDRRDTLMVGDGLNDGPSFSAAYCAATPAVDRPGLPARADFYFLGEGIAAVRRSLQAARRLRTVLRANLALALGYNALVLTLCFLGLVGPVAAAIFMPLSSLSVVGVTLVRLSERRFRWMS